MRWIDLLWWFGRGILRTYIDSITSKAEERGELRAVVTTPVWAEDAAREWLHDNNLDYVEVHSDSYWFLWRRLEVKACGSYGGLRLWETSLRAYFGRGLESSRVEVIREDE